MKFKFPDRRYVYVLNVRHRSGLPAWIGKVGFSVDPDYRAADIENSIWQITGEKVTVRRLFKVRVFMYRKIEAVVHGFLRAYKCRRFEGASGGSEFFHTFNPFLGLLIGILAWGYGAQCPVWFGLVVAAIPLPLDFIIYVGLLAAVEYVIAGALIWVLWCLSIAVLAA